MKTDFFFLSPVQAVKVTPQNLEEVAEWCGGRVAEADSRRVPGRTDKYVWVPTPKGSAISWAFPGMFVTRRVVMTVDGKFKETWAVFRRDYFEKNYFDTVNAAVDQTWEKFLKHNHEPAALKITPEDNTKGQHVLTDGEPRTVVVNIFQDGKLKDALEAATATIKEAFPEAEVVADEPNFVHDHVSIESCDANNCTTERYADGTHIFTDKTVVAHGDDISVSLTANEVKESNLGYTDLLMKTPQEI